MGATAAMWFTAASTAYSVYSQDRAASEERSAAREAERLAAENASLIEQEGEREQQLAREAQADTEAEARARIAASGGTGSQDLVLDEMEARHSRSLEWMKRSTQSQADITRQGGRYQRQAGYASASRTKAGAYDSLFRGIAQTGEYGGWWK